MKTIFSLAMAASLGLSAYAQNPASWKAGQEITQQIAWKAYNAADEDASAPAWQGFNYEFGLESNGNCWEWRGLFDADAPTSPCGVAWGVFNATDETNQPWCVYQDFTMPAGIFKVSVQGCYREGDAEQTYNLWLDGNITKNCFVFAQVGDDEYTSPMRYIFDETCTECLFTQGDWQSDGSKTYREKTIFYPRSHWGADAFFADGHFEGNEVTFIVPQETTVRVGIKRPVVVNNDQAWWDYWKMYYVAPYDETTAQILVAKKEFENAQNIAYSFIETVEDEFPALAELMGFEMDDITIDLSSLEAVNAAIAAVTKADADNKAVVKKAKSIRYVASICENLLKATNYAGRPAFEAAVNAVKNIYEARSFEDGTTVQDVLNTVDGLLQARIDYLLTQEKDEDGGIDLSNAISAPWFVNPEYNPTLDPVKGYYNFPDVVEPWMQGGEADGYFNDDSNLEIEHTNGDNYLPAISDLAHYTRNTTDENRWVLTTDWANWNEFFSYFVKVRKYPAFYSNWKSGSGSGGYGLHQVVTNLPEGYYTLEGRVLGSVEGVEDFATEANQYLYVNDAEGNQITKAMNKEGFFWWGGNYSRSTWSVLKSDFFKVSGGTITVGYRNNTMAANSGMVLKYYGNGIDYTALVQQKIDENVPAAGELWAGDLKTYNDMVATVTAMLPIADQTAYNAAVAAMQEAIDFKDKAAAAAKAYNLTSKYSDLNYKYLDDFEEDFDVMLYTMNIMYYTSPAWEAADQLKNSSDATYLNIAAAVDIYNAYDAYFAASVDAVKNYRTEKMMTLIEEQSDYLTENYASKETLEQYVLDIAQEKNRYIFEQFCANASEQSPVNITDKYIKNAALTEGPKKGWTCDGANPTINTYGRHSAECWNQGTFEIYQVLPSMPAGTYELRVRAFYRDRVAVNQDMVDRYLDGKFENNVQLFAGSAEVDIKSICDNGAGGTGWADPSFDKWYDYRDSEISSKLHGMGYMTDWQGALFILDDERTQIEARWKAEAEGQYALDALMQAEPNVIDLSKDGEQYPFDTKVGFCYYPASMAGFQEFCKQHPEAYTNSVRVTLPEISDLKLGFRKSGAVGSDWLIYDDFQLFYLGFDPKTGIAGAKQEGDKPKAIYNLAGQRLNKMQRGVNIVDGRKIVVK